MYMIDSTHQIETINIHNTFYHRQSVLLRICGIVAVRLIL